MEKYKGKGLYIRVLKVEDVNKNYFGRFPYVQAYLAGTYRFVGRGWS